MFFSSKNTSVRVEYGIPSSFINKSPNLLGPQFPQMVSEGDCVVISPEALVAILANLDIQRHKMLPTVNYWLTALGYLRISTSQIL